MLRLHRTRANYWSLSKLSKIIRKHYGIDKPKSATMERWNELDDQWEAAHPFVHWFTTKFFNKVQNIVMFIPDVCYTINCYYHNRFISKTHLIQTRLQPGEWHEFETRLFHGMFEMFVDFVEIELAHNTVAWNNKSAPTFTYKNGRCPEAGLFHLNWQSQLINECDWFPEDQKKLQPEYGKPTDQAVRAQHQIMIYDWWKNKRPNRVDPWEISEQGMQVLDNNKKPFGTIGKDIFVLSSDQRQQMEDQYKQEDLDMMKLLIDISGGLWT